MKWDQLSMEQCAISRFLAVMGDRWSLLILSDCFLGVRRFETFKARLGISRTMLSERLKKLAENGILDKVEYQARPQRFEYRLSAKGRDLYPVIMSMTKWGNDYYAGEAGAPILFNHKSCGQDFQPTVSCSECGEPAEPRDVVARARDEKEGVAPVLRGPIALDIG